MTVHCFFEQSGTFKKEFQKLGYEALDYDILDDFGETDNQIDLFAEIEKAFCYRDSIFDRIRKDDLIMAFFPCVRFEDQIQMHFRGTAHQFAKYTDVQKIEVDMKLHKELHDLYEYICMLAIVCLRGGQTYCRKPLFLYTLPNKILGNSGKDHRHKPAPERRLHEEANTILVYRYGTKK